MPVLLDAVLFPIVKKYFLSRVFRDRVSPVAGIWERFRIQGAAGIVESAARESTVSCLRVVLGEKRIGRGLRRGKRLFRSNPFPLQFGRKIEKGACWKYWAGLACRAFGNAHVALS